MKAKAIAGVLALGVFASLGVPTAAGARPVRYREPGTEIATADAHGTNGFYVSFAVIDGEAIVTAEKQAGGLDGVLSEVTYKRRVRIKSTSGRLHIDLGRAGKVDARLVVGRREQVKPAPYCEGAFEVAETGRYVGTISFHPPGGFTRVDAHRATGSVIDRPPRLCRAPVPTHRDKPEPAEAEEHFLVAGTADGRRRFEASRMPPSLKGESATTTFGAAFTRRVGALTITDSAYTSPRPKSAPLAIPNLDALPSTVTVEPAAPFSGSATFELPSSQTAKVSGDLAVELLEVGKVQLTGPRFEAGACNEEACMKSLPRALYPPLPLSAAFQLARFPRVTNEGNRL